LWDIPLSHAGVTILSALFDAVATAGTGFPLLPSIMTQKINASTGCQAVSDNPLRRTRTAFLYFHVALFMPPLISKNHRSNPFRERRHPTKSLTEGIADERPTGLDLKACKGVWK
jgi:hypothetical protein